MICCLVLPLVPYAMEWVKGNDYSLTSLSNPFMTLEEIAQTPGAERHPPVLGHRLGRRAAHEPAGDHPRRVHDRRTAEGAWRRTAG